MERSSLFPTIRFIGFRSNNSLIRGKNSLIPRTLSSVFNTMRIPQRGYGEQTVKSPRFQGLAYIFIKQILNAKHGRTIIPWWPIIWVANKWKITGIRVYTMEDLLLTKLCNKYTGTSSTELDKSRANASGSLAWAFYGWVLTRALLRIA